MDPACRSRIFSEEYADFMIKYGEPFHDITARFDTCSDSINNDTAGVYMPVSQIPPNMIHLYGYGAFPNTYGLLDASANESSGITKLRNIPKLNLRGQGVLIGIVDTGIEYMHDAFLYADRTSKIYSIWDQSINSDQIPEGFNFGTEYTKDDINLALSSTDPLSIVPSIDEIGHGTMLAGITAGNSSDANNFTGVVPDAELVIVKLKPAKKYLREFWKIPEGTVCYQKNDLILGVRYLLQTAEKARRPISIVIGIGTSQGAHDERGALSSYLSDLASQSGVCMTIAAGNEGNRGHHYYGSVGKGMPFDEIELYVGEQEQGFVMEFWGKTPTSFSIDILSPTGEYIPRIPARMNESRVLDFIFEKTIINVDYQLVESQSGDQLIMIRFTHPTEGIWRFRVYSGGNLYFQYHAWLPIHQFISERTYFIKSNPDYTLTSPGNTFIPIVATAYDYVNKSLYINASRGFMRNDNIAPTLAAPGVNMIAPTLNNVYQAVTGTSVAAAHTAGVAAMLLEWGIIRGLYPQISTVEIKNLLIRGAKRNPDLSYPTKEWGYGMLDVYHTYLSLTGDN
ncbi:MAG: hypothetical protein K0S47_2920 [Herbinix sp.]|jgi:subtilisin family serine protease|nr:hypothetical protein [Herbinix sp.]